MTVAMPLFKSAVFKMAKKERTGRNPLQDGSESEQEAYKLSLANQRRLNSAVVGERADLMK